MHVRPGHSAGGSDFSYLLAALDDLACGDVHLGHVHVDSDEPPAVVQIHEVAGVVEITDQCHDPAIGGHDRVAGFAVEVHTHVPAPQFTIEHAAHAEITRDRALSRRDPLAVPHARRVVRAPRHGHGLGGFPTDTNLQGRIRRGGESWIDGKPRGREFSLLDRHADHAVRTVGPPDDRKCEWYRFESVHRNWSEGAELTRRISREMQLLACHLTGDIDPLAL